MRTPRSLSPSAFMLWEKDPREYALKYLVDQKPPRMPQPLPASVGSAFDACVKSRLARHLFDVTPPELEFDTLFADQVEEHNRDEAKEMGEHCLRNYVAMGAYDELLDLMLGAQEAPQFEFDANRTVGNIPLYGKPDCRFIDWHGNHIILDWKVKGYCSKYGASPTKGYRLCTDGLDWETRNLTKKQLEKRETGIEVSGKASRSHNKAHDLYLPMNFNGVEINQGFLETCNSDYATQTTMYGWMMGEKVGDENVIVCIDEIVGKFMGEGNRPLLRVANHRARVSKLYQENLHAQLRELWGCIDSGWIFRDMSREDSDAAFDMLQIKSKGMMSSGSDEDEWFSQIGRADYR